MSVKQHSGNTSAFVLEPRRSFESAGRSGSAGAVATRSEGRDPGAVASPHGLPPATMDFQGMEEQDGVRFSFSV